MMNIAALEYGITRLEKVKEMNQNSLEPYKYDLMILKGGRIAFKTDTRREKGIGSKKGIYCG